MCVRRKTITLAISLSLIAAKPSFANESLITECTEIHGQSQLALSNLRANRYPRHLSDKLIAGLFSPLTPELQNFMINGSSVTDVPTNIEDNNVRIALNDLRSDLAGMAEKGIGTAGWFTSDSPATYLFRAPSGDTLSKKVAIEAIILNRDDKMVIQCLAQRPGRTSAQPRTLTEGGFKPDFALAESPAEFAKDEGRIPGRIALTLDREKNTQTVDTRFAITPGSWQILTVADPGSRSNYIEILTAIPFLSYQRTTIDGGGATDAAKAKEVNNVVAGLTLSAVTRHGGPTGYRARTEASLAYLTDDSLEGKGVISEFRYTPSLRIFPATIGGDGLGSMTKVNRDFVQRELGRFRLRWQPQLSIVADYTYVNDPGRSTILRKSQEFGRLGYEVASVISIYDKGSGAYLAWTTTYSMRDGFTDDGGDAQYLTSGLNFLPSVNAPFGLSLQYERGEVITSLEAQEKWILGLSIRID